MISSEPRSTMPETDDPLAIWWVSSRTKRKHYSPTCSRFSSHRPDEILPVTAPADMAKRECARCRPDHLRPRRRAVQEWVRQLVFDRDGRKCLRSGRRPPEVSLNCDHIVAVATGGSNDLDNLQTLCRECNREKWSGPAVDYRKGDVEAHRHLNPTQVAGR
jgi:5-methylcytosine-specific restriction endonuclease McrA